MDLVLRICDDYLLDKVWARLIPLSSFTSPELAGCPNITPNFAPIPVSSTWSQIVSHLPHSLRQNASLFTTVANSHSLTRVSAWPREYIPRQLISLCAITLVGIHVLYFLFAWLSYKFIFNHEMMKHPRFLKNQVKLEIQASLRAFPAMMLLTLPWFQAEVMGYSKVYDGLDTYGYFYLFASVPLCVFLSTFTYHKLIFLVTCSSLTTVSIGCIDGFISPSSTSIYTNRIINGSVRFFYTSTL
jgi:lathosterol oxidase